MKRSKQNTYICTWAGFPVWARVGTAPVLARFHYGFKHPFFPMKRTHMGSPANTETTKKTLENARYTCIFYQKKVNREKYLVYQGYNSKNIFF